MKSYNDLYKPLSPEDPMKSSVFFDRVLSRLNIDLSDPKRQIALQWKNIIGENLSSHCFFNGTGNGTVFVVCDSSAYVAMFKMNSKEVLKKINAAFPELNLSKVSVRIKSK